MIFVYFPCKAIRVFGLDNRGVDLNEVALIIVLVGSIFVLVEALGIVQVRSA